ncbi:MAG: lysylphosphatidylglycerol synthase transmembrane domain-containing protein [bacterium]|nr:lysylphosphatidylglycerol synthase transmembrane domain-containing protein [bacterium]
MKKGKYSIKLGILLFLLITVLTVVIILFRTFNQDTLKALQTIRRTDILVLLGLIVVNWLMEIFKLQLIAGIGHARIRFKAAFYAILSNLFFSGITPFQSGGAASLIYIMYQNGIGVGKGTAISFLRLSLTLFALGLATPICILFRPSLLASKLLSTFFIYSLIISFLLLLGYIYLLVKPKILKRFSILIITLLKKVKLISKERYKHWISLIVKEIDAFNEINISCWKYHKAKLFGGFFFTLLIIISQFLIAPFLLYFLYPQIKINLGHLIFFAIITQIVIHFIMYFIPTPGGSGFIEISFMTFFADLIPSSILGIYTVLWRFFSTIVSMIVGAFVTLKFIGIKEIKMLIPNKEVFDKNIKPHID